MANKTFYISSSAPVKPERTADIVADGIGLLLPTFESLDAVTAALREDYTGPVYNFKVTVSVEEVVEAGTLTVEA